MKISYDADIDALYIRFVEGKPECRTVRLNEEVAHRSPEPTPAPPVEGSQTRELPSLEGSGVGSVRGGSWVGSG